MSRRPPGTKRTDTHCPYTTLFRSERKCNEQRYRDREDNGQPVLDQELSNNAFHHRDRDEHRQRSKSACQNRKRHSPGGSSGCLGRAQAGLDVRSEEHTSELQSLMRLSYAVFCLKKKIHTS